MYNKNKPYISSVQTLVDKAADQNFTMNELNQLHFAILDHKDKYYSLNETKRYLDIKVIYNRYTYKMDAKTNKYSETKKT